MHTKPPCAALCTDSNPLYIHKAVNEKTASIIEQPRKSAMRLIEEPG
jgi:hypothetical protein